MNDNFKSNLLIILRKFTNDKLYYQIRYFIKFKRFLNYKNPDTFNAKINWLKLHDRKPKYTKLVDKYEVRNYVDEKIGSEYLNDIIGIYDNVEEIDFDKLPNSFVLNTTHGSNWICICKDKSKFDEVLCKESLNKWLKSNYYEIWGEYVYKDVSPRIICEKYLLNENENWLIDYKFFCFNGTPMFLHVDREISYSYTRNFYDLNWNRLPFGLEYPQSNEDLPKPKVFNKMIELATILAEDLKFIRVDFYIIKEKIYFGELTFYPDNGFGVFDPPSMDFEMGKLLKI